MPWYIGLYAIVIVASVISPIEQIEKTIGLIAPITLTALIASLLVPFAGFSDPEKAQKWAVQYGIVPLFGCYTVLAWHYASFIGFLLLAGATAVHLGYWTSSMHSRSYRLKMFDLAFGRTMPGLSQLVALLHIVGKAHIADKIVTSLIKSRRVYEDQLKKAIEESGEEIDLGDILKEVHMAND